MVETTEKQRIAGQALAETMRQMPDGGIAPSADFLAALCRDVDTLEAALRRQICPGHADVLGPETACEFGDRHCNEARAVLG